MALLQRSFMVADIRGEGPRVSRTLPDTGDGDQKMNSMAKSRVIVVVLAVATGLAANAQEQPVEQKQQTKQNQRMFYQRVYRYDQETMLEDPAITNRVTDEQILPDSNEQNIESRVLTLDDLQWTRFVPAPVASEGMEFVPGKGYVAGRTEQATEPGMSVLAPTLGFEATGGLKGGENSPNAEPFDGSESRRKWPRLCPVEGCRGSLRRASRSASEPRSLPGGDVWDRDQLGSGASVCGEPARPGTLTTAKRADRAVAEEHHGRTVGTYRALATLGSWKGRQNHLSVEGQSGNHPRPHGAGKALARGMPDQAGRAAERKAPLE